MRAGTSARGKKSQPDCRATSSLASNDPDAAWADTPSARTTSQAFRTARNAAPMSCSPMCQRRFKSARKVIAFHGDLIRGPAVFQPVDGSRVTRPAQPPNLLLIPQASAALISEHQITLPLRRLQEVCRRQCVVGRTSERAKQVRGRSGGSDNTTSTGTLSASPPSTSTRPLIVTGWKSGISAALASRCSNTDPFLPRVEYHFLARLHVDRNHGYAGRAIIEPIEVDHLDQRVSGTGSRREPQLV